MLAEALGRHNRDTTIGFHPPLMLCPSSSL